MQCFCLTILAKEQPAYGQQSCQYGHSDGIGIRQQRATFGGWFVRRFGQKTSNIGDQRGKQQYDTPDVGGPVILKIHQYIFVGKYKTDYRLQHECSAHNTAVAMLPDSDHDSRKGAPIEQWTVRCKPEQPRIRRILNEKQERVWDEGGETEYGSKHEESCAEDP